MAVVDWCIGGQKVVYAGADGRGHVMLGRETYGTKSTLDLHNGGENPNGSAVRSESPLGQLERKAGFYNGMGY